MKMIETGAKALLAAAMVSAMPVHADELSVATFVPPQHHTNINVWNWFAEEVAERTNGELTVRVYPAGQLGAGPVQQYKRVVEGVADAVLGVAGYTPELFPIAMLTIPPGASNSSGELVDATMKSWDKHFAEEFEDVHFLGIGFSVSIAVAATRDLSTLEGWQGAKIVPFAASMGPIIEAMGGVPVQMPVTEIYTALSSGTIDGALAAHNNMMPPWNWYEVSDYYIDNVPPQFQTVYFAMNKERYEALPEDHRAVIDELSMEAFSKVAAASFDGADSDAITRIRAGEFEDNFEYIVVSDEERARMDGAVAKGMDVIFEQYEANGVENAREIYNDLHGYSN